MRLGDKVGVPIPSIPLGLPTVDDEIIGCGGIPRGRIIEIFGPESAGKTTFCLAVIAEEQQLGGLCALVDAEQALDPTYAASLGVDLDNLIVSQPDSGEQALETVSALIDSNAVTLIVVDSVSALVPQAELDGDFGESHMGLQARLMSQAMRKLRGKANQKGVAVIFINQIREKIGVMFGSPETTSGGRALRFYASLRLDVRKINGEKGQIKSGEIVIGHQVKLKAVKNKVGRPLGECLIDLIYGVGFDKNADLVSYAIKKGVITKDKSWLAFGEEKFHEADLTTEEKRGTVEKIRKELEKIKQLERDA